MKQQELFTLFYRFNGFSFGFIPLGEILPAILAEAYREAECLMYKALWYHERFAPEASNA